MRMQCAIVVMAILVGIRIPAFGQMSMEEAQKRLEDKENKNPDQVPATKAQIDDLQAQIKSLQSQLKALTDEVESMRSQLAAGANAAQPPDARVDAGAAKSSPLAFSNVHIQTTNTGTQMIGEVRNNTGKDYQFLNLTFRFYDKGGNLLEISHEIISNFPAGSDKAFEADIEHATPANIATYKVDMDNGV
jgi:hypothetical protein